MSADGKTLIGYDVDLLNDLQELLEKQYGYEVLHITEAFDMKEGCLERSRAYNYAEPVIAAALEEHPSIQVVIDLHRDAYAESQTGPNTVNAGGVEAAKLMLLIGKGEGQTSEGFDQRPDWEANLAIAQDVTDDLNAQVDGLCRDVCVKSGRFNQHVAVGCVLVEAGNNRNTLEEVLAAMPYLADAIVQVLAL